MIRKIHELPVVWLVALVVLSGCPELRIGDVQLLEILQTARLAIVVFLFAGVGLRLPITGIWREYGGPYLCFIAAAFGLAVVALRLPFYSPSEAGFLKTPFVLSLSRLLELSLVIYYMLAIADTFEKRPNLLRVAMNAYIAVGIVSAICSIFSLVLYETIRAYTIFINDLDYRPRGFFNEGGPFGLFLTSVILVLLLKRRLDRTKSALCAHLSLAIVCLALLLSESKAGLLAAILCGMATLLTPNLRKRTLAAALLFVACICFAWLFQTRLAGYKNNFEGFDEAVLFRPTDRNLVMGRIMGAFIIPRMIAAHPVLGIGIGNYSLMRNDPDYLQGLPAVDDWDLAGLGLVSDAAELGIPLALFLVGILVRPLWRARRLKASAILVAAAAFQPVSVLLGVNLNFFYPWLVTAFTAASL
jgi:hypothetical protein